MVGLGHAVRYSFSEYLAHERVSNTRHEFLDGQIFAMAGGSPEHSALIAAFATHLANAVRGGRCIDSLRACALVAPDRREVELWTRAADGPWSRALLGPGATLELTAIGARLDLDAVFADAREPT